MPVVAKFLARWHPKHNGFATLLPGPAPTILNDSGAFWNTIPRSLIFIAIDLETFQRFCGALLIWTDDFETLSLILAIVVATVAPAPPACLDLLVWSSIDQCSPLLQSFGLCVLNATAAATFQPPSKCVLV